MQQTTRRITHLKIAEGRISMKLKLCSAALMLLALSGCKQSQSTADTTPATKPPAPTYFKVDPTTAATVTGTIKFEGAVPKPKMIDMGSDPACAQKHGGKKFADDSLLVDKHGRLDNTFVYVSKGLEGKTFATPTDSATIDQAGCWFKPRVLGLQTGQTLDIVNSDPVTHNIHPMPHDNREWNHSQGPGDPPMHRKFAHSEVMIPVKCNIHEWMHAYIGVLDHPYFAVTGEDGTFKLPNLPPGNYTVTAWHEGLPSQETTVLVPAGGKVEANLTFRAK